MATKTAVKERPILFSGPMVRAILDGRKTVTRRVIKPQPKSPEYRECRTYFVDDGCFDGWVDGTYAKGRAFICPFGEAGDRLWVRETWMPETEEGVATGGVIYKASPNRSEQDGNRLSRWRSPILMPRDASRLTLEVVSVRVERLQEITEEEAVKEGVEDMTKGLGVGPEVRAFVHHEQATPRTIVGNAVRAFALAWDSINGKGSWDSNPWVWVIAFNRAEKTV